jgi:thermitase
MSKRIQGVAILLMLCLLILAPASAADPGATPESPDQSAAPFATGEILVQWRDGLAVAAARSAVTTEGLTVLEHIDSLRVSRLAVPSGQEWDYVDKWGNHPLVLHAEPNYLAYADGSDLNSSDTYWLKQWNMRRVVAAEAWPLSAVQGQIVVAVPDSGVDRGHADLGPYFLTGYDFVNGDSNPADDYGHGTHVTGILAAQSDNARGVAGVAPGVSILPLKVLNSVGAGTYANIAAAIQYASSNGADIINLSLGGSAHSSILEQAVLDAYDAGCLLIASAGNQGQAGVNYPARYAEVLAVAATDHYDRWPSYSNWGPEVDLAAPGGTATDQIWSTWPGGYNWEHGTSMACPHVSGAAALMWAANPTLTAIDIAGILRQTADKVGQFSYAGGRNSYLGYGRLNVHEALRQALPPSLSAQPSRLLFLGDRQHAPAAQRLSLSNDSRQALQWQAQKLSGGSWLSLIPPLSGSITYQDPDKLNSLASTSGLSYGLYQGSVRVSSSTPGAQGTPLTVPVVLSLVPELTFVYLPALENERTSFEWLDASDGTRLAISDEMSATVTLPWYFPFYENQYDRLWVGDNGFVSFRRGYAGTAPDGSFVFQNGCLPSASQPNDAIYPFWDDLDPSKGGDIYVKPVGNDAFVVEWLQVVHWNGANPETFEVILRRDGQITFQYLTVADDGSATVGVENYDGTMSWQWLCNGTGTRLQSETALRFERPDL